MSKFMSNPTVKILLIFVQFFFLIIGREISDVINIYSNHNNIFEYTIIYIIYMICCLSISPNLFCRNCYFSISKCVHLLTTHLLTTHCAF